MYQIKIAFLIDITKASPQEKKLNVSKYRHKNAPIQLHVNI